MRNKPVTLYMRPSAWQKYRSKKCDFHFVETGNLLKTGLPANDTMGSVVTPEGVKNLIAAFKKYQPDIFLFWVHFGEFNGKLLKRLREISPHTVFVHGSGNQVLGDHNVCWYIHKFRRFTDVVLTNTRDKERLNLIRKWIKRAGTLHMFGFDPTRFTAPKTKTEFDCFFGGGDSVSNKKPNGRFPFSLFRRQLLEAVNKEFKLLLRGGGTWPAHLNCQPGVRDLEYFREMQRAKIILGTYHLDLEQYYTERTIYGGASGRLFMTRYIPGMEKDFTNGENIVWFKTVDEAMQLLHGYLQLPDDERKAIAKLQRAHFCVNHSWRARMAEFEKLVPWILEARK